MRLPQHRLRKYGGEFKKDGTLAKNQQRMGPLTLESRLMFLDRIIDIQNRVNEVAIREGRHTIDILDPDEIARIRDLIELKTFPNRWDGTEVNAAVPQDKIFSNGTMIKQLFYD